MRLMLVEQCMEQFCLTSSSRTLSMSEARTSEGFQPPCTIDVSMMIVVSQVYYLLSTSQSFYGLQQLYLCSLSVSIAILNIN